MTIDQRRALIVKSREIKVTLDGKPATIGGACNAFASVGVWPSGPEMSFSWPAVAKVLSLGGAFSS